MLIDTHAHIEGDEFDADRDEVLKRADEAGLKLIFNISYNMKSSLSSIDISRKYDNIYAVIGFHPSDSADYNEKEENNLRRMAKFEKVKAIGEIGLDYHYENTDKKTQKDVFKKQIELARELKLPIVIHSRDSDKDTFDILEENNAFELGVLMHCYGSSLEMAREYVKRGAILGIGGVLTFKNAKKLLEVVRETSLENLVLETDCPYLAPTPFRGKRNEPSYIKLVAEKMAEIKNISYEEVVKETGKNALRFYGMI